MYNDQKKFVIVCLEFFFSLFQLIYYYYPLYKRFINNNPILYTLTLYFSFFNSITQHITLIAQFF
ncbi:hypothetical protein BJ944DRAFT_250092 [Cunninghamella echinulata]|nr:hypothetical protein BJ944DRAFT_250092 [Cunninghamella echinulata]